MHIYSWEHDTDSHLARLDTRNTRALGRTATRMLSTVSGQGRSVTQVLELGPGAGSAAFGMKLLLEHSDQDSRIEAVSYTPVCPTIGLIMNFREIRDTLGFDMQTLLMKDQNDCSGTLNWNIMFKLKEKGHDVFQIRDREFIERQYIGDLRSLPFGRKHYSFVHDNNGAFYHAYKYGTDEADRPSFLNKILNTVEDNGLFYSDPFPDPNFYWNNRHINSIDKRFSGVYHGMSGIFLGFRKGSYYHEAALALEGKRTVSDEFMLIDDMNEYTNKLGIGDV